MESWKDIVGYEGLYKISDHGRVWGCRKNELIKNNDNGNGYLRISLHKNGKTKSEYIHRLVAKHFIPLELNKNIINHIDENTKNNKVDNLEWCNHKENIEHGNAINKSVTTRKNSEAWKKSVDKKCTAVIGVNINNKETIRFKSVAEAGRNGFLREKVSLCINGKLDKHRGYQWYKQFGGA